MRWDKKRLGQERTIKKFLLFPKTLPVGPPDISGGILSPKNAPLQSRWLETVKIIQAVEASFPFSRKWVDQHWAD